MSGKAHLMGWNSKSGTDGNSGCLQNRAYPKPPPVHPEPRSGHLRAREARAATVHRTVCWEATKDRLIKQVTFQFSDLLPFALRLASDQSDLWGANCISSFRPR